MDIMTIDATSYAARVGQRAAGELFALLAASDSMAYAGPIDYWFDPAAANFAPEHIDEIVQAMAAYVLKRSEGGAVAGETLCRAFASRYGQDQPWSDLDVARRQAFETFASVVHHVGGGLAVAQLAHAEAGGSTSPVTALKTADTIFEKEEGLFTMSKEAIAASGMMARYRREQAAAAAAADRKRRAQEAADRQSFNGADPKAFDHDASGRPGGSKPKATRAAAKPKGIAPGEAPAKQPQNRGGRGRTKSARDRANQS